MTVRRNLWGSRFREKPSAALSRLNDSLSFDRALLSEDVEGSIAWARALGRAGVLKVAEVRALTRALEAVGAEEAPSDGHEDVHSFVEARLARRVGALAGKLHTGRSRNDQVAVDLRLYLREAFSEAKAGALAIADALADRASEESGTPMPGYTHPRRAEPITFGHWCLAYVEMLLRDASRLEAAATLSDECPLGSGALSGRPGPGRPIRAGQGARLRAAVGQLARRRVRPGCGRGLPVRGGAAPLAPVAPGRRRRLLFLRRGRLSFPFRTVFRPARHACRTRRTRTCSSCCAGTRPGRRATLAGSSPCSRGLPLAYNKDLQLDKEPVFRLRSTLAAALPAAAELARNLAVDRPRMRAAAADDRFLATELADALAARGVAFRPRPRDRRAAESRGPNARGPTMREPRTVGGGDGGGSRRARPRPRAWRGGASSAARPLGTSRGRLRRRGEGSRPGARRKRNEAAPRLRRIGRPFRGSGRAVPDLALILAEGGAHGGGVFTRNRFPAAPVALSRAALRKSGGRIRAAVVNSGCANAITGRAGTACALRVRRRAAELLACDPSEIFLASTGVIGVPLPDAKIRAALPDAVARLSPGGLDAASQAILTTDVGPKVAAATFRLRGRLGRIVGFAKGAGMIHPNMATMLAFLMTDAPASPEYLQAALRPRRRRQLQRDLGRRRHLDQRHGPPHGLGPARRGGALRRPRRGGFPSAPFRVCAELAWRIVRDGEGATRVMDVQVRGAASVRDARLAAHAVATSPLVKTALHGGDPNWGRILAAVAEAAGPASRRAAPRSPPAASSSFPGASPASIASATRHGSSHGSACR